MTKVIIKCDWCGSEMQRFPSRIKRHNFCSRNCLANYSNRKVNPNGYMTLKDYSNISANMSKLNAEMNADRMTAEVKEKLRNSRLHTGSGKSYEKTHGRHTHIELLLRECWEGLCVRAKWFITLTETNVIIENVI